MQGLIGHAITAFMGFFAIMNPIANAPIFVGLTSDLSRGGIRRVALRSTLLAFSIVATFSIGGHVVFKLFGIGLAAFRVAGGVLVFLVGKHLLEGQSTSPMHTPRALARPEGETQPPQSSATPSETEGAIAISPLAVPILAGPGTIACAINFSSGRPMTEVVVSVAAFAVLCVITFVVFVTGEKVLTRLGPYTLGVLGRLMGLILAVIGVQMILDGLGDQFPQLFR